MLCPDLHVVPTRRYTACMGHKVLIQPILGNWLSGAVWAPELAPLVVRRLPLLPDLVGFMLNEGLVVPLFHLISRVVLHIQMICINTYFPFRVM